MADTRQDPREPESEAAARRRAREREIEEARARARDTRARVVRLLMTAVTVVAAAFAVILALHIAFVVFHANPDNPLVTFVQGFANGLVLFFHDLFTPADRRVRVLVNYGLAAVFWLVAGRVAVALLRRVP